MCPHMETHCVCPHMETHCVCPHMETHCVCPHMETHKRLSETSRLKALARQEPFSDGR